GNIISGNGNDGILLNLSADATTVQGNMIGLGEDGSAQGNAHDGIDLGTTASDCLIGGPAAGAGNDIANNGGNGVVIAGPDHYHNCISCNQIADNAKLGIDLNADGVTANDQHDADD